MLQESSYVSQTPTTEKMDTAINASFNLSFNSTGEVNLSDDLFADFNPRQMDVVSNATSTEEDTDHDQLSLGSDDFEIKHEHGDQNPDTDAMLARAMNSLSMDERSKALHDLHGVAEIPPLDPSYVTEHLDSLEVELNKIHDKQAYDMAKQASPDYVYDPKFRMLFLRSDNFDVEKAALRIVRHFELKLELFGPDLLGRNIRLSDLNEEDLKALRNGATQWLNQRDRAGRAVLCWTPSGGSGPVYNRMRVHFYSFMNVIRDEETQKRGMVGIAISVGEKTANFDVHLAMRVPRLSRALPTRFVAFHACFDKSTARAVLDFAVRGVTTFFQVRYRSHFGTMTECLYTLMTFGIPSNALPLNADGTVQKQQHIERVNKRLLQEIEMEKSTKEMKLVLIPGPFDVLLGRGKLSQEHMGNFRYRALISSYQEKYEKAKKTEKTAIADEVVSVVKKCSGRFLTEYYADFIEIDDAKAREKVSHSFRTLRIKKQQEKKKAMANGVKGAPEKNLVREVSTESCAGSQSIGKRARVS